MTTVTATATRASAHGVRLVRREYVPNGTPKRLIAWSLPIPSLPETQKKTTATRSDDRPAVFEVAAGVGQRFVSNTSNPATDAAPRLRNAPQWLSDGKQPVCSSRFCFGRNLPLSFWLPVELFLGQYRSLCKFLFGPRGCAKHRSASRYHWCERHQADVFRYIAVNSLDAPASKISLVPEPGSAGIFQEALPPLPVRVRSRSLQE